MASCAGRRRQPERLPEEPLGQPLAETFEDFELARRRRSLGCEHGVGEVALCPSLRVVVKDAVVPLEIHRQRQRFAHAHVAQMFPVGVEGDRVLHADEFPDLPDLPLQRPVVVGRDVE